MSQPASTHEMKRAATLQLFRFKQSIIRHVDEGKDSMNPRIKNLMQDIEKLQDRIDALDPADPWPTDFTDEFKQLYRTIHRLRISLS
jgi:hypothetical protein